METLKGTFVIEVAYKLNIKNEWGLNWRNILDVGTA